MRLLMLSSCCPMKAERLVATSLKCRPSGIAKFQSPLLLTKPMSRALLTPSRLTSATSARAIQLPCLCVARVLPSLSSAAGPGRGECHPRSARPSRACPHGGGRAQGQRAPGRGRNSSCVVLHGELLPASRHPSRISSAHPHDGSRDSQLDAELLQQPAFVTDAQGGLVHSNSAFIKVRTCLSTSPSTAQNL